MRTTLNTRMAGSSETGITLVELLVGSLMGVIVMGAVASLVISSVRLQPKISERAQSITTARWALERMTREIRNGISVDPNHATAEEVSFHTFVRRTVCGGNKIPASNIPAIPCQVTYRCTTTKCSRIEAVSGTTGTEKTIFEGIDSSDVFSYVPNPKTATFIKVTLRMPNPNDPSGPPAVTVSDGASMRNAVLTR